jgi:uncharacterized membrane protein
MTESFDQLSFGPAAKQILYCLQVGNKYLITKSFTYNVLISILTIMITPIYFGYNYIYSQIAKIQQYMINKLARTANL